MSGKLNALPVELVKVNAVTKTDIMGTDEIQDFVELLYSGFEAYEKAMLDGKLSLDDLLLLGEFTTNLLSALNGSNQAFAEIMELTDQEIIDLVDLSDAFQLGENALKYKQVVKEILYKFQTWSVFK